MFAPITPTVRMLLVLNIGVFLIESFLDLPLSSILSLKYLFSENFQPYQVFTYMFVHADFWHLFGNMIVLFFFGPMLENFLGSNKFLIFYVACGIGASLFHGLINYLEMSQMEDAIASFRVMPSPEKFLDFANDYANGFTGQRYFKFYNLVHEIYPGNPDNQQIQGEVLGIMESLRNSYVSQSSMLGASGATLGVLLGFGLLFPEMEIRLLFFPFFPIKAIYLVTFFAAYEIYSVIEQRPDDNIAHFAHIGGMLIAFIIIKFNILKHK
ncbi:rhomboid family intramembrane serine protease [Chondrinema litorale]|uniref:rhomboid family intramembrane serine protease n=1 Tax=Chondrinema litorale TaxID=2994555 RepID=UPI002542700B|nr:rhomboid family intramembrane serine protease [Chondrinema litorale]UZR92693.1 rhomboid family intramembrane serine protease [Chondrinema litorale]